MWVRNVILGGFLLGNTLAAVGCSAVFDDDGLRAMAPGQQQLAKSLGERHAKRLAEDPGRLDAAHFGAKMMQSADGYGVRPADLDQRRLEALKSALVGLGVPADQIVLVSD